MRIRGRSRKIIVALLLVLGIQTWLIFAGRGGAYWGRNVQLLVILLCAGIALIPPINRSTFAVLRWLRRPSPRLLAILTILVTIGSALFLYFDATYQKRSFQPKYHDEFSYMLQTRMIASGRLFAPMHPLADFFETFQVVVKPAYASVYFPGAAIMYTPGVWLELKQWVMPLIVSSLCAGMLFLVVAKLIDGASGIIAAIMLLANPLFRLQALMVLAQAPALLLMLVMFWAWLNWRKRRAIGWAIVIGAAAGWCAITRPLDALCVAIPIGAAMLLALHPIKQRHEKSDVPLFKRGHHSFSMVIRSLIAAMLAALPFLGLQLVFNKLAGPGWFTTPFSWNIQQTFPQTSLGFRKFEPTVRPASNLPQKQAHYDKIAVDAIKAHTWREVFTNWGDNRLRLAVVANVPMWLMMVLLPAGLLGILEDRRKLVLWLTLLTFVALYIFYPFYLAHYVVFAAPAVILNLLAGADVIARAWPRRRRIIATFFALALSSLSISEFAQLNRLVHDEWFEAPQLMHINATLAKLEHKPAVVLFRWSANANSEEEPVYNSDVVWPDQAEVIRAHDLGELRNKELYRYYALRWPHRAIYLYDRGDDTIKYLGTARELADTTPSSRPAIIVPAK